MTNLNDMMRMGMIATLFLLSGCVLATPVVSYEVVNDCGWPVRVSVDSARESIATTPMPFDTSQRHDLGGSMWDAGIGTLLQPGESQSFGVPGDTEDVEAVFFDIAVDAGGELGSQFVLELPVVEITDREYEFPDGPIAISDRRCPPGESG